MPLSATASSLIKALKICSSLSKSTLLYLFSKPCCKAFGLKFKKIKSALKKSIKSVKMAVNLRAFFAEKGQKRREKKARKVLLKKA